MEKLKQMKEALVGCVQGQVYGNIEKVNAQELGSAIDMIKDLSEAIYYCTITEAMEKEDKEGGEKHGRMYYTPKMMPVYNAPIEYYDPRYRSYSMYAQGDSMSGGGNNARGGGSRGYHEGMMPMDYPMYTDGSSYSMYAQGGNGGNRNYTEMMRDPREGRSGQRRRMYMEGKSQGKDKAKQMQELEEYMHELTSDLTEMVQDASPEEKQLLQQKISTLATKIK